MCEPLQAKHSHVSLRLALTHYFFFFFFFLFLLLLFRRNCINSTHCSAWRRADSVSYTLALWVCKLETTKPQSLLPLPPPPTPHTPTPSRPVLWLSQNNKSYIGFSMCLDHQKSSGSGLVVYGNVFLCTVLGPGQQACTVQANVVHWKYLPLCCTGTGQIACTIKAIVVHCKYLFLFCTGTQSDGPHNTGNIFLYSVLVPGQIACTIWGISSSMLYWYLARLPPQYGEYLPLFCAGTRSDSPHRTIWGISSCILYWYPVT